MLFFVHYSIVDGTEATFVNDVMSRMPTSQRTIYSAVAAAVWSVFSAIAASTSGYLQDLTGGFGAAFGMGVIAYFVSAAWLLLVLPRIPSLFAKTDTGSGLLIAKQEAPRLVPRVTGNGHD
jgi:hypothetical protein